MAAAAVAAAPADAARHLVLGQVLQALGRLEDARASLGRAVGLTPDEPTALACLGRVLRDQGHLAQAESVLRQAVAGDPASAAVSDLGALVKDLGRPREAVALLRAGRAHQPGSVDLLNNLGVACYEAGLLADALEAFEAAIAAAPDTPHPHNNLANLYQALGDMAAATRHYEHCRIGLPANRLDLIAKVGSNLLMCLQYQDETTAATLAAAHADWQSRVAAPLGDGRWTTARDRDPDRRLRVGFAYPHWGLHPATYLTIGALAGLDRGGFETIAYIDVFRPEPGAGHDRVPADRVVDSGPLDDAAFVERVRADGVDLLIDLAGHSGGNRLLAFARRAAPVQLTWAGYAGTTGLAAMDYLVADAVEAPDDHLPHLVEAVIRMPGAYVTYSPPATAPPVGPPPIARDGIATFGCFNNPGKINDTTLVAWGAMLARLPDWRLVLKYRWLDDPLVRARLESRLTAAGIDPARVAWEGVSPQREMMRRWTEVDVALDCQPYAGGVTTLEALYMGVPVPTVAGPTFAARHSATHMTAVGLGDLVARDWAGWIDVTARLARDPDRLATIRDGLRTAMVGGPLGDHAGFAREFGDGLRQAWKSWANGRPPTTINVARRRD